MPTEDPNELTTISITKGARELLRAIGRKNETYDDLIKRLAGFYNRLQESGDFPKTESD